MKPLLSSFSSQNELLPGSRVLISVSKPPKCEVFYSSRKKLTISQERKNTEIVLFDSSTLGVYCVETSLKLKKKVGEI